jgi:chromosome segregation ATPase
MKSKHKRLKRKIARKNRVIYCLTEQLDVMRERMDDAEKFHSLVSCKKGAQRSSWLSSGRGGCSPDRHQ